MLAIFFSSGQIDCYHGHESLVLNIRLAWEKYVFRKGKGTRYVSAPIPVKYNFLSIGKSNSLPQAYLWNKKSYSLYKCIQRNADDAFNPLHEAPLNSGMWYGKLLHHVWKSRGYHIYVPCCQQSSLVQSYHWWTEVSKKELQALFGKQRTPR